jgi:hypothetical protein
LMSVTMRTSTTRRPRWPSSPATVEAGASAIFARKGGGGRASVVGVDLPHPARRPHRLALVPGAYTQYAKPHPRVPTFLSAVYWHVTAEDPPEDDDDLDY